MEPYRHLLHLDQRVEHFELIFFRLLHFLAHHPDFSSSQEDLPDIAK
jgi:sister-chromatid-cohesion protein PDS5